LLLNFVKTKYNNEVDMKKATFLYVLVMVKIYTDCCLFTTIRCPYEL